MPDEGYYTHERPELVAQVPEGAARVLDVGCGAGAMSAALKRDRHVREVWGIEVVQAEAERAQRSGVLDVVLCGDVEALAPDLPRGGFSHIVIGDALEHTRDPWTTLAQLRACLEPGGRVICSLPNIRNLSFILKLLFQGRFEYKDSGVMDRTHLRFFARRDVELLFEGAGFTDIAIGPVRPKRGLGKAFARAVLGDLAIKGFLVTAVNPGA